MSGALLPVLAGLLVGLLLGGCYFALLRQTVRLFQSPGPVGWILALTLLRVCLAIAVFWGLVQFGAWALLAGLVGFLLARYVMQRQVEI